MTADEQPGPGDPPVDGEREGARRPGHDDSADDARRSGDEPLGERRWLEDERWRHEEGWRDPGELAESRRRTDRRRRSEADATGRARRVVRQRRRLVPLAVIAVMATLAGLAVGRTGGEDEGDGSPPRLDVPLDRLIGQRIVVRMEQVTKGLERRARRGEIGGVVLFPPEGVDRDELRRQVKRLQRAAVEGGNPPLLVAIDQEGFPVRRLPTGPPSIPPASLDSVGGVDDAKLEGEAAANFLKRGGVNANLAPVLDVPASSDSFLSLRAYGSRPDRVAKLGSGVARGHVSQGVAATAKHFPGLGRAAQNTDLAQTTIGASEDELAADLRPFEAAIKRGVPLVMVSSAAYTAYDPGIPAVLSEPIVRGLLRGELGFSGAVISDDLEAEAVRASATPAQAALDASVAGVDLLMFARTGEPADAAADQLRRAVKRGLLSRSALEASYLRITDLKRQFARAPKGS